jgi:hypothetical protein
MIIYNYLAFDNINFFGDGSLRKRRYRRLKAMQMSKLPKIGHRVLSEG